MTTNPHLKLTKWDTHPTPGVKGGLPARFRLPGSYGGTPKCCQCIFAKTRQRGGRSLHRYLRLRRFGVRCCSAPRLLTLWPSSAHGGVPIWYLPEGGTCPMGVKLTKGDMQPVLGVDSKLTKGDSSQALGMGGGRKPGISPRNGRGPGYFLVFVGAFDKKMCF